MGCFCRGSVERAVDENIKVKLDIMEIQWYRQNVGDLISQLTVPKYVISQPEAVPTVPIPCDIKSLSLYGYDIMHTWPNLGVINT